MPDSGGGVHENVAKSAMPSTALAGHLVIESRGLDYGYNRMYICASLVIIACI